MPSPSNSSKKSSPNKDASNSEYDKQQLHSAVVAVKRGELSIRRAAQVFGVPRWTISRYLALLNAELDGRASGSSIASTSALLPKSVEQPERFSPLPSTSLTKQSSKCDSNDQASSNKRKRKNDAFEKESKDDSITKGLDASFMERNGDHSSSSCTMMENEGQTQLTVLPMSRLRTIMKSAADVTHIGQDALLSMTKATEFFIAYIAQRAYQKRQSSNLVQYSDLAEFVQGDDDLDFLHDVIPRKVRVRDLPIWKKNKKKSQ